MAVKTWVGRFSIVEGQPQEEGPLLRSFPRQRPDEDEDELYVLAEPATPGSREYCGQLVDAVGRMFREDTLSMTGAVLRSLKAAHHQLRDWNERSLREHHVTAGVSCIAVRDRTAYLAQVGPAIAYHVGDGRVSRVVPEDGAATPLGQGDQVEPRFGRFELSPGDLLVVATPRLESLLDQETLRSVLLKGGDDALVELFQLARSEQDFSLVLFACVVEGEDAVALQAPAPAPLPAAATPEEAEQAEAAHADPTTELEPVAEAEGASPESGTQAGLPPDEEAEAPPSAEEPVEDAQHEMAATAAEAGTPPAGLSQPRVRLKGAGSAIDYRRTTGMRSRLPAIPPIAIVGVVFLVAAGLLAWLVIPPALRESRDDEYTAAVEEAQEALDTAVATDDPALRRESLRTADAALSDAEAIRPDEPELADLRLQVDSALADLNAVVELPELELIADVGEQIPGPVSSKGLALGGGGAYFLDQDQQRVIAVALLGSSPEPFVLFEAGDLVGVEIMGAPQHIAWAEDLGALLVMDDARRVAAVTPPGQPARVLTVRDAGAWDSADGIAYREGTLYALDRAGDQVWRYPPTEGGFDSEREPLVASFDLEQALELAVADALYLVVGEDGIARVQGGAGEMLSQAGIDRPLASPGSLVPLPSRNALLVADRGQRRVVVFSLDGAFRQQWTSPRFTDLRAIAVDEPNNLLYLLVGSSLYRTTLPALP